MGIDELREISIQLSNDVENFQVGIEQFDNELQGYEDEEKGEYPNLKRLEELKRDMELWIEDIERSVEDCGDEIRNYKREIMLKNLEDGN